MPRVEEILKSIYFFVNQADYHETIFYWVFMKLGMKSHSCIPERLYLWTYGVQETNIEWQSEWFVTNVKEFLITILLRTKYLSFICKY